MGEEETDVLKAVKESVHRMAGHLQLISGYLEMEDYTQAPVAEEHSGAGASPGSPDWV
jgi:hypothetical protein